MNKVSAAIFFVYETALLLLNIVVSLTCTFGPLFSNVQQLYWLPALLKVAAANGNVTAHPEKYFCLTNSCSYLAILSITKSRLQHKKRNHCLRQWFHALP